MSSGMRAARQAGRHHRGRGRYIKPMFETGRWKIVRGDTVMIMAGKDKGQTGTVLQVIRDKARPKVKVEGRNLVRMLRPGRFLSAIAACCMLPQE